MSESTGSATQQNQSGKAEALKTFIEQTKMLVSLASGFILAPPAILSFFRRPDGKASSWVPWSRFLWAEGLLVASIFAGYVVLGAVAGTQEDGTFDVYRKAIRVSSIFQIALYLAGIVTFLCMLPALI